MALLSSIGLASPRSSTVTAGRGVHAQVPKRFVVCAAGTKHASETKHAPSVMPMLLESEPFSVAKAEWEKLDGQGPRLDTTGFSLAHIDLDQSVNAALNAQINVEQSVAHLYQSLYAYFSRDNVALFGLARLFQEACDGERKHGQMLIDYVNLRGGRVELQAICAPPTDFSQSAKGAAMGALELALSVERMNYIKLKELDHLANTVQDYMTSDLLESTMLKEQIADVNKAASMCTALERAGCHGHGLWHFDAQLQSELGSASTSGGLVAGSLAAEYH